MLTEKQATNPSGIRWTPRGHKLTLESIMNYIAAEKIDPEILEIVLDSLLKSGLKMDVEEVARLIEQMEKKGLKLIKQNPKD